jgi:hypothetical protein
MEKPTEENEITGFSWNSFFLVTGSSLTLFSFILKGLDGQHSAFFLYAGCIALALGILGWVADRKMGNR